MFSFCILYLVILKQNFKNVIYLHLHSFIKVLRREKLLLLNMASNMI